MGPYVGCLKHQWLVYVFSTRKLPPTSKSDVEDGNGIDTIIGKGQYHNTRKSLSMSKVLSNSKSDLRTPGNMEVLSTYVTHPCDGQKPNT